MGCFWTDFVGCVEDCGSPAPAPLSQGYIAGNAYSDRTFTIEGPSEGSVGSIVGAAFLVLRRIDMYIDRNDCAQSLGPPPGWFPAGDAQFATPGAPDPVISATGMSLLMPFNSADNCFIVSMADLSAAMGGPDVSNEYKLVAYVEVDTDDGTPPYYGAVVGNYCF